MDTIARVEMDVDWMQAGGKEIHFEREIPTEATSARGPKEYAVSVRVSFNGPGRGLSFNASATGDLTPVGIRMLAHGLLALEAEASAMVARQEAS